MKIYLVGAQSTGKTTIANHISKEFGINKIKEVAREKISEYGNDLEDIRGNLDTCKEFQRSVFREQIEKEKKTEEPFISDRGIDILAYIAMHTDDLSTITKEQWVKDYIKRYHENNSIVVFVRPVHDLIEDDGVRTELSVEHINQIDGMIKFILEFYDINYHTLETKHLNERIRSLRSLLEQTDLSHNQTHSLSDFL